VLHGLTDKQMDNLAMKRNATTHKGMVTCFASDLDNFLKVRKGVLY
jgi:hypothetical protein